MSTPERDLEQYEREQARADAIAAELERNAEGWVRPDDEIPSCAYCGKDIEDGDCHVIKNGATIGIDGPDVDIDTCGHCFANLQREKFLADLEALTDVLAKLVESAPTQELKNSVSRVSLYAKELIDKAIEHFS